MKKVSQYLWGIMIATLMLTSCSKKKNDALQVIPDDYEVVINVQLTKLTDAAGDALNGFLPQDAREGLKKLDAALDLNSTIIGVKSLTETEDQDKIVIAIPVKNEGDLKSSFGSSKSKNGFDVYGIENGFNIAVKDKIAYLVPENNLAKSLKVIEDALDDCNDDDSMADMKGATEAFSDGKAAVTVLVNTEFLGKKVKEHGGNPMAVVRLTIKDKNTIDFNGYSVYPDGTRFKMEQPLADVSSEMLKYAGPAPIMTVAAGFPGNYDWKKVFKQYNSTMEEIDKSMVLSDAEIMQFVQVLNNIDGTVLLSIGMNGTLENTINTRPDITLLVQCKPGTEVAMLNMFKFGAKQAMNVDVNLNPDLTPTLNNFGPVQAYVGAIDGMVIVSSKKPEKSDNNLAADFKGKQMGFILNLPSMGMILPALDTKIDLKIMSDGNEMTGSLTCVDKPIIEVLSAIAGSPL